MKDNPQNTFQSTERYKILSPLGAGGMGAVFLAEDLKLKRKVALKVLKNEILSNKSMLTRTKLEGLILARLRHPSLASVYEMDMDAKQPYIVQEYIDGSSIKELVKAKKLFNKNEALHLLKEQADVLAYLHSQDIFHRDIKPDNIMIDRSGKSILMDFGLALSGDRTRFTKEDAFVGTLSYCAPEVLQGEDGGPQSDIFQLGLVIYEAITGQNMYGEFDTSQEFIELLFSRNWENAPMDARIPLELRELLHRICQFDPKLRPANGTELLKIIKAPITKDNRPRKKADISKKPARRNSNRSMSKGGKHEKITTNPPSPKRRIWLFASVTTILILLFFGYFVLREPATRIQADDSRTTKDLLLSARTFLLSPDGFSIFLPSKAGKNVHWKLEFANREDNNTYDAFGKFQKVAGGWKAIWKMQGIPLNSDATLSIFDNEAPVAFRKIKFPESVFREPLKAVFSYDKIRINWKFHGEAPAVIVVRRLKGKGPEEQSPILTRKINGTECTLMGNELGKNNQLTISLHLPALHQDSIQSSAVSDSTRVGQISGSRDLSLKFRLSNEILSDEDKLLSQLGHTERSPACKIRKLAIYEDRLYLTTRSGHVYGLAIDPHGEEMFKVLWKHDFREIPALSHIKPSTKEGCPPSLIPMAIEGTEDGLSCFGIGRGLKIHHYDLQGNHSERPTPFSYAAARKPPDKIKRYLKDTKILKTKTLYTWQVSGKKHLIVSSNSSQESKPVIVPHKSWILEKAFSGLDTTFLVLKEGSNHVLYYLKQNPDAYELNELRRFPITGSNLVNFSTSFCLTMKVGLFGRGHDLFSIHPDGSGFSCREININLPERSFIRSILRKKTGSFISLVTSWDKNSLSTNTLMTLQTLYIDFRETDKVSTVLKTLKEKIVVGLKQCDINTPVMIDKNRFCFCAGMTFLIISTDNNLRLYRKDFFSDPDKLAATKDYIMTAKFSNGAIFGLPLLPQNK